MNFFGLNSVKNICGRCVVAIWRIDVVGVGRPAMLTPVGDVCYSPVLKDQAQRIYFLGRRLLIDYSTNKVLGKFLEPYFPGVHPPGRPARAKNQKEKLMIDRLRYRPLNS